MAVPPNSEAPSQADTPMTDTNEEQATSVPVDSADTHMTVSRTLRFRVTLDLRILPALHSIHSICRPLSTPCVGSGSQRLLTLPRAELSGYSRLHGSNTPLFIPNNTLHPLEVQAC